MLKWKANEGERMLSRTKVPGPPNSVPATPGDIIACLKANPEAMRAVRTELDPYAYAARDNAIARAEQAERDLATLRELIHTASGLDDHRYSAEQMVKEMAERWQGASDDCEKAEQALATVTAERDDLIARHGEIVEAAFLERDALKAKLAEAEAERDEARYWLAAHKAASESLVDPITGQGFFMLIGKGDDGKGGWSYTFGGPFDSYTLCERSDDEDPHFVYFQRERYDHDQGGWADGVEVVEPVLAPDECSVAPYCLEDVTEERDALKRERDEARAWRDEWHGALQRIQAALAPKLTNKWWWTTDEMEAEVMRLRDDFRAMQRERDEARALLADLRADLSRAQNVLAPEVGRALTAEEMAEEVVRLLARIREHEKRENALHSKGMQFRQDRDALKAKLAEAERMRDTLGRRIDEVQAALNECGAGFTGQKESTRIRALRARLAKVERVVEAARKMLVEHDTELQETENEARLARALRALDEDSPVGVAATAEAEHAVCGCHERAPCPNADAKPRASDPQAPATRAELEELRREVDRLESLTDNEE